MDMSLPVLFEFVETHVFTKLSDIAGSDIVSAIQGDLREDPKRWPVVSGTKGARKGRVARPGEGKRGGYRYLYLYLERHGIIYLLFLFAKNDQGNLTARQKQAIAGWVDQIVRSYEKNAANKKRKP